MNKFSFLLLFVGSGIHALSMNMSEIKKRFAKDQACVYSTQSDNVVFTFDGENFVFGSLKLGDQLEKLKNNYTSARHALAGRGIQSRSLTMRVGLTSKHQNTMLSAREEISLFANQGIDIIDSVVELPKTVLATKDLTLRTFVVGCDQHFVIQSVVEKSPIKYILLTFKKDSPVHYVQAKIDLETGKTSEPFLVVGSNQIEIGFNDHVFEN